MSTDSSRSSSSEGLSWIMWSTLRLTSFGFSRRRRSLGRAVSYKHGECGVQCDPQSTVDRIRHDSDPCLGKVAVGRDQGRVARVSFSSQAWPLNLQRLLCRRFGCWHCVRVPRVMRVVAHPAAHLGSASLHSTSLLLSFWSSPAFVLKRMLLTGLW
jgi:hypothetical protein